MSDHHVPASHCPACGLNATGAFNADGDDGAPMAGDFTVCIECGAIAAFTDDGMLRALDDSDREALRQDPLLLVTLKAAQLRVAAARAVAKLKGH